jgi:hypothetical protein
MDLLRYQSKAEFKDVITQAKSRVEAYAEARLFDRDGANGARFSLQCNFKWSGEEKKDVDSSAPVVRIVCDIPRTAVERDSAEATKETTATQQEGESEGNEDAGENK